ncbi:MAG TPA: YetF domain-containing protein [Microvirga sp.]|nr:YetF domain-containing protein [Microvirga sp.]
MGEVEGWFSVMLGAGLESRDINVWQMGLRAAVVYVVTVIIVRIGKKRFMGRATAFDVILGIMLGSIVSRAVTGNSPLLPALAAAAVLVGMHWLFSGIAMHWHGFGNLIKGKAELLVRDGSVDDKLMAACHMTEHDLWEDLRGKSISDLRQVTEARLERSGQLSVIKAKQDPKIVDVRVADGVQTVRIEIAG